MFPPRSLIKNLASVPGWTTGRKLVIIESDDWGSIRMPSSSTYKELNKYLGLDRDDGHRFNKYDRLETSSDLEELFKVLTSVRDKNEKPAVFTPITLTANPDFEKIRNTGFTQYHYNPLDVCLEKYNGSTGTFELWKEGIARGIFLPQFHGREHLNVPVWMKALNSGHEKLKKAFEYEMWGISTSSDPEIGLEIQAAFDFSDQAHLQYQEEVIETGLQLFEKLFGFRACYFVAPNGIYNTRLEPVLYNHGIRLISVAMIQKEPLGNGHHNTRLNWTGRKRNSGIVSLTRNCVFEPGQHGQDWIDRCLNEMKIAFRWHKPAVITTHRVNYSGGIDEKNRTIGLRKLKELLNIIVKKWPDAEFISTAELKKIMKDE